MEYVRTRLLLAKLPEDTEPSICGAVDEDIWNLWDDAEELAWIQAGKRTWGLEQHTEFKVVVARFAPQALVDAFAEPEVDGLV